MKRYGTAQCICNGIRGDRSRGGVCGVIPLSEECAAIEILRKESMKVARYVSAALLMLLLLIVSDYCMAGPSGTDLYRDSINEPSQSGGKPFVMGFTELERHPHYSIVKIDYVSGSSVGSAMYVVKGCWEIARQRQTEYFINLKEWRDKDGKALMKVGFTNDTSVNIQDYFGDHDSNKELRYLSVSAYAPLWKR